MWEWYRSSNQTLSKEADSTLLKMSNSSFWMCFTSSNTMLTPKVVTHWQDTVHFTLFSYRMRQRVAGLTWEMFIRFKCYDVIMCCIMKLFNAILLKIGKCPFIFIFCQGDDEMKSWKTVFRTQSWTRRVNIFNLIFF